MGYVAASYLLVVGGVAAYLGWLAVERSRLRRALDDHLDSNRG